MKNLSLILALGVAGFLTAGPGQADAAYITGLFGTGEDANGAVMASGADLHYPGATIVQGGYPLNQYAPNDYPGTVGGSVWVSLSGSTGGAVAAGTTYTYTTTFLDAGPAAGSFITGLIGVDDTVAVSLNGTALVPPMYSGFSVLQPFSITSGFQTGLNTLTFVVTNTVDGTPEALRVKFLTFSSINSVPEPASLAMLGLGLGLVGVAVARRRKVAVTA